MQRFITAIAAKHSLNFADVGVCLCLDMTGYDRLTIEILAPNRVSVSHSYDVQGFRIPAPDVEFVVRTNNWFPIRITQSLGGHRIYAVVRADGSRIRCIDPRGQADLASFCEAWSRNLKEQGWLEHAVKNEAASGYRMALPKGRTPRFSLGQVVATPGALEALESAGQTPEEFLIRHVTGDFGELDAHDREANEQALEFGGRILSAYTLKDGTRLWLITESDRSATTFLKPDEY
jgi:hypothetical protein